MKTNDDQHTKLIKQCLHIHNIYIAWSTVQHIIVKFFWWGRKKPLFSMFHGWKHAVFSFIRKISLLTLTLQIIFGPMAGTGRHCIVLALNGKKNQECTRVQPVQPSGPTLQYFAHQFMELFWINITSKRSSTTNTVLRCYQLWTNFSIQHFVWSDHNLVAVYNKHWWLMNDQTHWCMNKILGSCYSMQVY